MAALQHIEYYLLAICVMVLVSSCSISNKLSEDDLLLKDNKIEIHGEGIDKRELTYQLNRLIVQRPNSNFLGIPREWIYYRTTKEVDSSFVAGYIHRNVGEAPVLYEDSYAKESAERITLFLRNKKGYFDASVDYELIKGRKKIEVIYHVYLGERAYIASIQYLTKDTLLRHHIEAFRKNEGNLKVGDPIDEQLFAQENGMLVLALQNQGFANFATNYITILGDSSTNKHNIDIMFDISPPLPDSTHQRYNVGNISVYPNHNKQVDVTASKRVDTTSHLIIHRPVANKFIRDATLRHNIYLKKGELYNRDERMVTYRKLSSLGMYKFVSINTTENVVDSTLIDYHIRLTPYKNRWVADFGADLFYAVLSQQQRGILGFSFNTQFKNRNAFGGAEQLTLNAEVGTEVQLGSPITLRSETYGFSSQLEMPRLIDLSPYSSLIESIFYDRQNNRSYIREATTTLDLKVRHTNLIDYYSISSFGVGYSYNFSPELKTRLRIKQIGINYDRYRIQEKFQSTIDNNPLQKRSFSNTLITGFLLNELSYLWTKGGATDAQSSAFIGNLEFSGLEIYAANNLYNVFSSSNDDWRFVDDVRYAKFVKLDGEYRHYFRFKNGNVIATRLFGGIAIPYGKDRAIPFVKQFSIGGPNSLRGWNQKELGPGGYDSRAEYADNPNRPYYQQGDIRLEANIEYRFDLFWLIEGALFVDAGNVWSIIAYNNRSEGLFTSRFYDQIAVAAGYGFRFDFTYFNLRLDFGYKLRNPYLVDGRKWNTFRNITDQGLSNFRVAVNYPF